MAKLRMVSFLVAAAIVAGVSLARAQAPTGDISGRLTSSDGLPLPGVTVEVTSPSAPGSRSVTTSENGDYLIALLPPGTYTVTFNIEGFQTLERTINVAGTQNARLDTTMSPAGITATVDVVAQAQPFVETAQVATNFKQQLMASLPSNRTVDAVLLMAPAVHPTGPRGAYTINGSQSYENLYILNGVVINENLRGLPMTPYIEDALQEITVSSAGVSAEYGRFSGGVATAVTKSGGNTFGGSFRTSFANDNWRSLTPFQTTQLLTVQGLTRSLLKADKVVPTYEATFGGPVKPNRLWFFSAMRSQEQVEQRTTVGTNIPYERRNDERRYEGKLTYTPKTGHSLQGSFFKLNQTLFNFTGQSAVADLVSLTPQGQPQTMVATQYTGVLTPNFSVSAQYAARKFSLTNVGSDKTDRIFGTLALDLQRNWRYWSPTFCAGSVCDGDEQRNNENFALKGSYFLSNNAYGTHNIVFGYDYFNDNIIANTHPSGSDYRVRGTSSIVRGNQIFPVWLPGSTTLDRNPIEKLSEGSNLRVHSLFANDSWRLNERVTLNVGLRLDKNDATDGDGKNVGNDVSVSPRLSAVWDPNGRATWALTGSFARYTMALTSNLAGATAEAGNAATYRWVYSGAPINAGVTDATPTSDLTTTEAALRQVFEWHDQLGGDSRPTQFSSIPGVNMKLDKPLTSPYSIEYSGGVSRALGQRGTVRADVVYRNFRNFYSLRADRSTGTVTAKTGTFDKNVIENSDVTDREYVGLTTQATYNFGSQLAVGGNYTLSHAYGSLEGETAGGPSGALANNYPEYRVASWNYPEGDLAIDQRHRARMWATYDIPLSPASGTFSIGLMQQFASGAPFPAMTIVPTAGMIANPGYVAPPPTVEYFFLGRDPFRTESTYRTDLAVNYGYRFGRSGAAHPELFFHGEMLNVFNQFQMCGCGENVFRNGGISDLGTISQAVQLLAPFNPYTTAPVEGVNWRKAPGFGEPQNTFGYTSPRIFRFSVGLRF